MLKQINKAHQKAQTCLKCSKTFKNIQKRSNIFQLFELFSTFRRLPQQSFEKNNKIYIVQAGETHLLQSPRRGRSTTRARTMFHSSTRQPQIFLSDKPDYPPGAVRRGAGACVQKYWKHFKNVQKSAVFGQICFNSCAPWELNEILSSNTSFKNSPNLPIGDHSSELSDGCLENRDSDRFE